MIGLNRRHFLYATAAAGAFSAFPAGAQQEQSTDTTAAPSGGFDLPPPDQREGRFLEREGSRIFYQTFGDGSPMLLLHGYPLSGALFARVVDQLSENHLVITVDHRGYGQSETTDIPDSVDIYADDALAVLDELGIDQATIGGMSMGGPIAFSMYEKAPDRFNGLILIDTIAAAANPAEKGLWNGVVEMAETKGVDALIPFLMPDMLTGDTRKNMPEQVEYLKSVMSQCSQEAAIGGATALANRPDRIGMLPGIDVSTLILVGLADAIYPFEIAEMMQSQISGSELHVIPAASHAAIFEKPDDAASAIMDWAGGTPTGSISGQDQDQQQQPQQ